MAKKETKPGSSEPAKRKRKPTLDVDERGLLVKHHLDAAAATLHIPPDKRVDLTADDWASAIAHYKRAVKHAGTDQPQLVVDEG